MFENKDFEVELEYVENEGFEIPSPLQSFKMSAIDIQVCVIELDKLLYKNDVTGHLNDFTDEYNYDETSCSVKFGDSECGSTIRYSIAEIG